MSRVNGSGSNSANPLPNRVDELARLRVEGKSDQADRAPVGEIGLCIALRPDLLQRDSCCLRSEHTPSAADHVMNRTVQGPFSAQHFRTASTVGST